MECVSAEFMTLLFQGNITQAFFYGCLFFFDKMDLMKLICFAGITDIYHPMLFSIFFLIFITPFAIKWRSEKEKGWRNYNKMNHLFYGPHISEFFYPMKEYTLLFIQDLTRWNSLLYVQIALKVGQWLYFSHSPVPNQKQKERRERRIKSSIALLKSVAVI